MNHKPFKKGVDIYLYIDGVSLIKLIFHSKKEKKSEFNQVGARQMQGNCQCKREKAREKCTYGAFNLMAMF